MFVREVILEDRVMLNENGRIVIPAAMRKAMKVKSGDELLLHMKDGELRVTTRLQHIRKAQELVRRYIPEGVSLADELIAERREAAKRE